MDGLPSIDGFCGANLGDPGGHAQQDPCAVLRHLDLLYHLTTGLS